ncbi:MAG: T9SS type A sorting domain-containing protein [Candidatus Anammoxibacter sp.]
MKNIYNLLTKEEKAMKKNIRFYSMFLAFSSIIIILFGTELFAQTNFTQVTNQPVFSLGTTNEWDDGAVWFPAVIKDADTLRMWYTGFDRSPWATQPLAQIGYAWSLDGIEWNRDAGNPVLTGELNWEGGMVMSCAVIKDGDIFKMWYGANGYAPDIIGYATSIDGIIWSKHSEPVLENGPDGDWDNSVIAPHTVIKEDSLYKMWYWGGTPGWPQNSTVQIGLATSTDGINWVKYDDPSTTAPPFANSDPVLKRGVAGEWDGVWVWMPMVLPTETGYEMWYIGGGNFEPFLVGYATSTDGILWTKLTTNPILNVNAYPTWGTWYGGGTVLKFDEEYHLWYYCFHTTALATPRIGYATSPINPVSVESTENEGANPTQYRLLQNYPNPFNPNTIIKYQISDAGLVSLQVYNLLGEVVATLVNEEKPAGSYEVEFSAKGGSASGGDASSLPSGIYFYKLQTGSFVETKKMVLLR